MTSNAVFDVRADEMRRECALRLGLPANTDAIDVLRAIVIMTNQDVYVTDLQGLARDMGTQLRLVLR